MPMKLYADPNKYLTKKILVAATYAGLEIEVPKGFAGAEEGRIPVLETEQGCIFSTNAIARYVSRMRRDLGLYGQSLLESGAIDSWIDFGTHELEVPLGAWLQQANVPPAVVERAKGDVQKALTVIDNHLLHFTWMAGEQVSLADISLCCVLHHGMSQVLTPAFLSSFGNVRRWFNLCTAQPEFAKVLGKVEQCSDSSASKGKADKTAAKGKAEPKKDAAPKKEAGAKKEPAPKKEAAAKKDAAPKKDAKAKKGEEEEKPKTPEEIAEERKKQKKKCMKEGGKRGVEIEGAADMGGLQFFCTAVDEPNGDIEMLSVCVEAMNAKSDPSEEERKGGSGHIGKMIFSAGTEQLAVAAYVPEDKQKDLVCEEWLKAVLANFSGKVESSSKSVCIGTVKADGNKGVFPLKIREPLILEANNYLRKKGLFPEDNGSDDDEFVFGDDDFPSM